MRPQSAIPLTLEEHRELGSEMRATNARLQELCKLVVSVYGPNAPAAFTFAKIASTMERLCHDLQAQAAVDLPGYPTEGCYVAALNGSGPASAVNSAGSLMNSANHHNNHK